VHPSWSPRPGAADLLLQWLQQYSAEHYEPVGVVEVHPDAPTVFRWEDAARARAPESPYHLVIFHRRADE
jgi:hypothetical protein